MRLQKGLNAGLVGSLALYAKVNNLVFVEISFYPLKSKNLKSSWGFFYLTSKQEEEISSKVLASFLLSMNETYFRGVSPIQAISLATSLIPFLEHNDANRVLMGSNMQRQVVPLVRSYKPIVGTGLESIVAHSSGSMILSQESAFIEEVNSKKIILNTWPFTVCCMKAFKLGLGSYAPNLGRVVYIEWFMRCIPLMFNVHGSCPSTQQVHTNRQMSQTLHAIG